MKKYKIFILAFVCGIVLASCSKETDDYGDLDPNGASIQNLNDKVSNQPAYSPRM